VSSQGENKPGKRGYGKNVTKDVETRLQKQCVFAQKCLSIQQGIIAPELKNNGKRSKSSGVKGCWAVAVGKEVSLKGYKDIIVPERKVWMKKLCCFSTFEARCYSTQILLCIPEGCVGQSGWYLETSFTTVAILLTTLTPSTSDYRNTHKSLFTIQWYLKKSEFRMSIDAQPLHSQQPLKARWVVIWKFSRNRKPLKL